MKRTLSLVVVVSLAACSAESSPAPTEVVTQRADSPAAAGPPRVRAPDTVRALVQAGDRALALKLDARTAEAMQARLDAHRATFRYVPDLRPKADPGAPVRGSFIEDDWVLHLELERTLGAQLYAPACVASPCVIRLDLDGTGTTDAVVSAWDKRSAALTFAVSSSRPALIGARVAGLDLSKLQRWSVVSAAEVTTPGFTRQGVLIETGTPTVRHLLFQDASGVRVVRL